jgi:hypothetical protein
MPQALSAGNWAVNVTDNPPSVNWALVGQGQPGSKGLSPTGVVAVVAAISAYATTGNVAAAFTASALAYSPPSFSGTVTNFAGSLSCASVADARMQAQTIIGILNNSANWA